MRRMLTSKSKLFSDFVIDTVLPLLDGGDVSMPYYMIAKQLREYVEGFETEVTMWTDAPYYDWPFVKHMFDTWGWPSNLNKKPQQLLFNAIKEERFNNAVKDAFRTIKPALRMHHALDDAIANRIGYLKTMRY